MSLKNKAIIVGQSDSNELNSSDRKEKNDTVGSLDKIPINQNDSYQYDFINDVTANDISLVHNFNKKQQIGS